MKTMKPKILVAAVLTLGIALAAPVSAVADGIPTVDWAAAAVKQTGWSKSFSASPASAFTAGPPPICGG